MINQGETPKQKGKKMTNRKTYFMVQLKPCFKFTANAPDKKVAKKQWFALRKRFLQHADERERFATREDAQHKFESIMESGKFEPGEIEVCEFSDLHFGISGF